MKMMIRVKIVAKKKTNSIGVFFLLCITHTHTQIISGAIIAVENFEKKTVFKNSKKNFFFYSFFTLSLSLKDQILNNNNRKKIPVCQLNLGLHKTQIHDIQNVIIIIIIHWFVSSKIIHKSNIIYTHTRKGVICSFFCVCRGYHTQESYFTVVAKKKSFYLPTYYLN